jgi:hypothetical protein
VKADTQKNENKADFSENTLWNWPPRLCTFVLAALNLQVLFYTKAFSIHLAPATQINNPCNLFNWVPPNCNYTSIGFEDSGLLEYDVLSISKKFLMFQKITMPSSSGSMHCT